MRMCCAFGFDGFDELIEKKQENKEGQKEKLKNTLFHKPFFGIFSKKDFQCFLFFLFD